MTPPDGGGLDSTRPELAGSFGMVASTHWIASQVGMSVLERGGNAADAAVAAGFVLQVVEPQLCGPAGEVPVLLAEPDGAVHAVCGQGSVPAAADQAAFAALGLDAVPGTGLLAATVPGAFGGWLTLLQGWGSWRLRDVLAPAIGYADDGIPVHPRVSAAIGTVRDMYTSGWPTSAATYLDAGRAPRPWSRLRLPVLAGCYRRLLAEAEAVGADRDAQIEAAADAWYRGFVAEAVGAFCAGRPWPDSTGRSHRGLLTADDLAGWRPRVEPPVRLTHAGAQVCKPGPWSQGPVLLQQLALLGEDTGAAAAAGDPQALHLLVEYQKLAYADREAWYGDPDVVDVPLAGLLSAGYAGQRRLLADPASASRQLCPGSPDGRPPVLPRAAGPHVSAGAGLGEPGRGDTCHLDVVDRRGLMVSATPSGGWLQSSPVIPELGFPLGTRAQMTWLQPGLASTLRPGTRPRSTLSPTLVLRDGAPWVALGTPGGDQQDQWSLLLVLRLLHGGRAPALQAAIDAPMLHTEHAPSSFAPRGSWPGRVVAEDRWPVAVLDALSARGHDLVRVGGWSLGRLSAVAREPGTGWLRAGANPRGAQGYAVGR